MSVMSDAKRWARQLADTLTMGPVVRELQAQADERVADQLEQRGDLHRAEEFRALAAQQRISRPY
jgi:hypothetical protein